MLQKKDWKKRQLSNAYFNDSAAGTLTTAMMPGIEGEPILASDVEVFTGLIIRIINCCLN
ncbi:hypothetical protein [Paenibacillus polymyxa]|uniref:hypothetical protein n=1 Tax=Paenibacillus polymyxa TaxID=1406 RepID=UPI000C9F69B5|nr:hypothetical protein [Paenibacillus polymyxa]PNQ85902.1 hypothetical protein C1T20_10440 [Paenibacillus polymyxa]